MTIYIVALEPIDQRYTAQWYTAIPEEIKAAAPGAEVVTVDGAAIGESRSTGAFLDFALTNIWKNTQLNKIAEMFSAGTVKAGDKFLFTDAWNTGIIQLKYMSDLLKIPVEIHGIWHAGSYDKTDILGFTIKDKAWSHGVERAIYHACDYNWFGSKYHRDLFCRVLELDGAKAHHSGQPHKQILDNAATIASVHKKNIVLFGHRLSPDKQPEIFEDLAGSFPDYKFVSTQKLGLSKAEYYELVRESKLSFSCNLHENFGIAMVESVFNGTWVCVPDRLSYREMYLDEARYPSEWTASWESYQKHKPELVAHIRRVLDSLPIPALLEAQQQFLLDNYMTARNMVAQIVKVAP